jgi:L-serine dehydratase
LSTISLFNDVLGPIMRGPSSSHTAASFRIATLARHLLADEPAAATITFDPGGSFGQVFRDQGSDLAFAAGLMSWSITEQRFPHALELAPAQGLEITFRVEPLPNPDHPNRVLLQLTSRSGSELQIAAMSVGGGAVVIDEIEGWPLHLTGDAHHLLVVCEQAAEPVVRRLLDGQDEQLEAPADVTRGPQRLLQARSMRGWKSGLIEKLAEMTGVADLWLAPPIIHIQRAEPLFTNASDLINQANGRSLGQMALAYESALLGMSTSEIMTEVLRRFEVMRAAVRRGLGEGLPLMQLLQPSARQIYQADAQGLLPHGGMHTRAAARAMAVMHVNGGSGVVCAAPTAGSAGVVPGALVTLVEETDLSDERAALALLAAAGIGLVIGTRATFAAEVAGCQVEIGAAGAMAAAAVVEAAGGTSQQACDAAAIALQNTMGSVCDLVQGIVEIPCHTRNAVAASSAFVCADLVMGGYTNPIPLDETIDAMYSVGKMLPRELKVTALGGLACAPSAQTLPRIRPTQSPTRGDR